MSRIFPPCAAHNLPCESGIVQNAARLTVDSDALLCYNGRRGDAGMKLKLAKWCSIIPLFVYALCAANADVSTQDKYDWNAD